MARERDTTHLLEQGQCEVVAFLQIVWVRVDLTPQGLQVPSLSVRL